MSKNKDFRKFLILVVVGLFMLGIHFYNKSRVMKPCPSGYRWDGGFCVFGGTGAGQQIPCGSGPACGAGLVCMSGQCVTPSGACSQLCATPNQATTLFCWSQDIVGVVTATMVLNGGQQGCCPVNSGVFTAPFGVTGTYTGRAMLCQSRQFETLTTGAYGGQL